MAQEVKNRVVIFLPLLVIKGLGWSRFPPLFGSFACCVGFSGPPLGRHFSSPGRSRLLPCPPWGYWSETFQVEGWGERNRKRVTTLDMAKIDGFGDVYVESSASNGPISWNKFFVQDDWPKRELADSSRAIRFEVYFLDIIMSGSVCGSHKLQEEQVLVFRDNTAEDKEIDTGRVVFLK
uniref:Uncharacterized protein n=1 Tax=Timema poppense TaxID=170557 RepID=A0A7R9GYL4_TIMPO|nr:unnamed protein product [Timema poppensis]